MRIAQIAPLAEAVPPKLYGGTERVVSWLAEALVSLGHEVTLFASGDSCTSAELMPCVPLGLRLAGINDHTAHTLVMLDRVREMADRFDILHFHVDLLQFALFRDMAGKCLTTLHGRQDLRDVWPIYEAFPEMPLVSISDAQRKPVSTANFAATVHHGMPPDLISFSDRGGEHLAFVGRISPEKRPDRAIAIAQGAGAPLKIAAKVDPVDEAYFRREIEPLLDDPLIEFVGEVGDDAKRRLLGGALALLFPIDWPEPFGLAMIEAMAAGTPVIAWRNGSVPEVVDDGMSGIIVDSMEEAIAAVDRARALSRRRVRSCFERRFTARRMARSYEAIYAQLTEGAGNATGPARALELQAYG